MARQWLTGPEIARFLEDAPAELCDLVIELRELVQHAAPAAHEKIAFNSLCYYKPGQPYGVIGGNLCLISIRDDCAYLGFIHGAFLPDPDGLLRGKGKAKRQVEIRSAADIRRAALGKLIRAALRYAPDAEAGR